MIVLRLLKVKKALLAATPLPTRATSMHLILICNSRDHRGVHTAPPWDLAGHRTLLMAYNDRVRYLVMPRPLPQVDPCGA